MMARFAGSANPINRRQTPAASSLLVLVSPRPHPLEDVARYRPGHEERLEVTPGITGLSQVTARRNPSFETCMLLDLAYIRDWSLWLDYKILLRTIPAVLAGEGQ
jgi:lipopolysaccharide/colanic/teichoic acid biosynthesis glycosyltransferase